jgi:dimethylhistidine N-methyltransferase
MGMEVTGKNNGFAHEVQLGLSKKDKAIPCKYFYDVAGEELFRRITELQEYYLTDCEYEILNRHQDDITSAIGKTSFNLVELGAGDGKKTKVLINQFLKAGLDVTYIPIDICEGAVKNLIDDFNEDKIDVCIKGLVAEYFSGIKWLAHECANPNLVLFLGSNIGNFDGYEAELFLRDLWTALNHGDYLFIGFDLKKDVSVIDKAYNDSENVTAEFNLNLLHRINSELGGNFDLDQFEYYGYYNEIIGAVQSYLVSQAVQTVYIKSLNRLFTFEKGERIHTENSFKFTEMDINRLADNTGFESLKNFTDPKEYFMDSLWQVIKE